MIQEFTIYLETVKRYSHNTAIGYKQDLEHFARWAREKDSETRWSNITREDIDSYMAAMTRAGRTAATINRHVSAIKAIYRWFTRQGWMTENPAQYETMQKLPKREANTIPAEDLHKVMSTAIGTAGTMIRLLASTGIRVQEMLDIEQPDIEEKESRLKIHGKGGKERYVHLTEGMLKEIQEYAKGKPYKIFGEISQRAVRAAIYNEFRRVSSARQLSPHAIRHTVATTMAKNGANVTTIAAILGHDSIKTTQKYIDMAAMDTKAAAKYIRFS